MSLHHTLGAPSAPPGPVYTALQQTAISFTGGLAVAQSAAFVLYNPPVGPSNPKGVRIVPLIAHGVFVGTATTPTVPMWGIVKLLAGTASFGLAAQSNTVITQAGLSGTATGVAVFAGSATILNGTAGGAGANNTLSFVTMCGALPFGAPLGTAVTGQIQTRMYLDGEVSIMPGEIALVQPGVACVGVVGLTYVEVQGPGAALSFA
jgi:hypothetical protein